ncbi:hypothetical protein Tco_0769117 [Tanacetum coccineum]|uniref:Uncharacterized protein n=1 Tax=Tanacetum coccineum TaxID=301880 RepID=A0ABQ4Z9S1_9ASTR
MAILYHDSPTVVAGPPAGLISPPDYPFQAQGCTCYLSGPFYPSKAQQQVTSITQAHQLGHGPLPAGSTHFTQQPGVMGPTQVSGHANTLPHAFTTETLRDFSNGVWNMDTGPSSHLNSSINILSEIFNTCMYPSISVGDGHSISVTNAGHSILPTPFKSLHLNNGLITPHNNVTLVSLANT